MIHGTSLFHSCEHQSDILYVIIVIVCIIYTYVNWIPALKGVYLHRNTQISVRHGDLTSSLQYVLAQLTKDRYSHVWCQHTGVQRDLDLAHRARVYWSLHHFAPKSWDPNNDTGNGSPSIKWSFRDRRRLSGRLPPVAAWVLNWDQDSDITNTSQIMMMWNDLNSFRKETSILSLQAQVHLEPTAMGAINW